MTSQILTRSGRAVVEYCNLIQFCPKTVYMVGIGPCHEETQVITSAWPDTDLVGFEPNPIIQEQLKKDFPGRFFTYALSNYVGKGSLYSPNRWKNGASLFRVEKHHSIFPVEVTKLDALGPFLACPSGRDSLLWLDCEGSELDVLLGGEEFVTERIAAINVEMTGMPHVQGGCKPIQVHRWLVKNGFLQTWSHTHRTTVGQWDGIYLRYEIFKPQFCNSLDSVERYENWGNLVSPT